VDNCSKNLNFANHEFRKMIETAKETSIIDHAIPDSKNLELATLQMGYKGLFENLLHGCVSYKVLFDEMGNPVDLKYMKVNSAYAKNSGRPISELIGQRITKVFPHMIEESFPRLERYSKVALFGEPVTFIEYVAYHDKWYSISAYSPQRGYVVEISEDITEGKRNELKLEQCVAELAEKNQQLAASQSRYHGLLEHLSGLFAYHRVIVDAMGCPIDLEFAEVNSAFESRTGLKSADIVGRQLPTLAHGIDKAYWVQVLGAVVCTGKSIVLEQYVEEFAAWYRVSAYSPEPGHVASILEDITEQKKSAIPENPDYRQVALIERVASLGALAAGVAHEINQPLQALKIMADGMIYWYDKGKETSVDKVIENCRGISVQAGYIAGIVEWMQDSVNKAWSDTPEAVDLNKMIKQALMLIQERLRIHRILLRENICALSPTLWGDVSRLKEIVIIILVNAIESLDCVDETTKEIVITTSTVGEKAVIEISNNGPAIVDDIIGKIFEPFFSSSKVSGKLGMGLAIVKSVVNAHNGTIQVSNFDRQVTFRLEFPLYLR
jgi:signal transduction histidine kinase